IRGGNDSIIGMMLESNIEEGNQKLTRDLDALDYGVSITDACIGWDETETLLRSLADDLREPLLNRSSPADAAAKTA
ncbi:MAG: hypothetical protein O7H39_14870, partial [Gammaproteobacteria bacterium]|nr:hypothetical protein [Gammaproteobacteria bacterium]